MVANEMFLDSATQRSSVVSQAKLLNYTPRSAVAPRAEVNITVNGVTDASLTLPAYSIFTCSAIDGVNYTFVNPDAYTVNVSNGTATFNNVVIKQGVPASYNFTVNSLTNPTYMFEIPDDTIDTSTLQVLVQKSITDTTTDVYNLSTSFLTLDGTSKVYFLQESLNGNYEIYFGDNILGKQLDDGNIVSVSYLSTEGTSAAGANSFTIMQTIGGYSPTSITSAVQATTGSDKESIASIKYQAPKSYAAQNRAVTKEDYITAIQQNNLGYSFDAINVWGGQENDPPVYGQIFISLKPSNAYTLTSYQKQNILEDIIKPISVLTVEPTIMDPDYTYIKMNINVLYDPKKTNYTANQIQSLVTSTVRNFAADTLNTFNSTYSAPTLTTLIQNADSSIITNEVNILLQKKFYPDLTNSRTYKLYFGAPIERGEFPSGLSSFPDLTYANPANAANNITGVYLEEVTPYTGGVDNISIINPGYSYQYAPTVTIYGDGSGATAEAVINTSGSLSAINVLTSGNNYTSAIAVITPAAGDTTGTGGAAIVNLTGAIGTIRSFYYDNNNAKTILDSTVGTIDYEKGIVTLNDFSPRDVDNTLGQFSISVQPETSIISSSLNRIVTVDTFDYNAITVNVIAKTS
jgi:hypothetical protein